MSELIKALVAARKDIGAARKDSTNPHFKSKYADLSSVVDAAKPIEAHGLAFVQDIRDNAVVTVILHSSGERMDFAPFPIVATKQDAQGYGSALTYARRYSLQTALGIPSEDDDGNKASEPVKSKPTVKAQSTAAIAAGADDSALVDPVKRDALTGSFVDLHLAAKLKEQESEDPVQLEKNAYALYETMDNAMKMAVWIALQQHSATRTWIKRVARDHRPANVTGEA